MNPAVQVGQDESGQVDGSGKMMFMSTRRVTKSSAQKKSSKKPGASAGIRAATSKVSAKTSINFVRSVRGK